MRKIAMLFPFSLWLLIFILIPLGLIFYYGVTIEEPIPYEEVWSDDGTVTYVLQDGTEVETPPRGTTTSFSLANLKRVLEPTYLKVMWRSLYIALMTTAWCLLLGYPVALILTGKHFKRKNFFLMLIILPMWMNFLLRTYAWLSLLEDNGIINNLLQSVGLPTYRFLYNHNEGSVILGMVYNFFPFMVLPLYTVMEKIDHSLLEAASDLGATPRQCFLKVTLPFSLPGVLEGVTMVFVPAVTTFVISQLMGSGKVVLIGDIIQNLFGRGDDWHFGSLISLLVMVIVLAFMYALQRTDHGKNEQGEVRIF